jgi:hypothetical protein
MGLTFERIDVELPWPEVKVPTYKEGKFGRWTMGKTHGMMPGYFTMSLKTNDTWALKHRERFKGEMTDVVWMSITPMEQESHMLHIAAAHGHTVVMGLGMGMYLYNIIQKEEVRQVTVIEKDSQVIELLPKVSDFDNWPGIEKVRVVNADARKWKTNEHVDFLYVDTWKHMHDERALTDTQLIYKNVKPDLVGYWIQEGDYDDFLRTVLNGHPDEIANADTYDKWCEHIGLPMIGKGSDFYANMACASKYIQLMAIRPINIGMLHFLLIRWF